MGQFVFPKVDISKPKRSKRDLSKFIVGSVNAGAIYPVLTMDVLPTDDIKIRTNARIESLPMIAPVIGRWKASFDYYFEPFSNLYGFMDNNKRMSTADIITMERHQIQLGAQSSYVFTEDNPGERNQWLATNNTSGRGSINEWFGVPIGYVGALTAVDGFSITSSPTNHPLERWLAMLDIVRNYYINNQETVCYYTEQSNERVGNDFNLNLNSYTLNDLDNLFSDLRHSTEPLIVNASTGLSNLNLPSFGRFANYLKQATKDSSGLFVRTYRMDLLRGIMNSNVGSYKSIVSTTDDGFSIDTLRFANKLQMLIDRIDITGGRFSDWIRTRWSAPIPKDVDRPVYLGSHSAWIDTTDVVATASGSSGAESLENQSPTSTLGQQAGFAIGGVNSKRPIHLKSNEYGLLICCFSLTPDVVYSQGFELDMLKTKFADIYDPAFSQLGYQDVSLAELNAKPIVYDVITEQGDSYNIREFNPNQSVGKRIAWSEYMASLPRAYGHFAFGQDLDYWVNNRSYLGLDDFERPYFTSSTYIDPTQFNNIFADKTLSAENFRIKVNFNIEAWRPIGKRIMPHL